ncbi:unnamed protein product [Gongylonema pulchrum]|uniref:Dolichyl-P-Glc:Glc(2)Man(9)GlcNAc(2)-PP-dolichol alpha-1,2-glucosyltransferase n=1 Tax=Gongylonema pulchrum TaxID=637853 RepID=A0A183E4Y9_9BILA|nr:unnamed protein product [Gongylonema pulchrum]VDN27115.1 unnamed protein product [Gongylonema pulchrum]
MQLTCILAVVNGKSKLQDDEEKEKTVTVATDGDPGVHRHKISLFKFQWEHVSVPLTISFWFFTVTIMKVVFHRFQRVHSLLPDSALLIILGLFFGYVFHVVYPDEVDFFVLIRHEYHRSSKIKLLHCELPKLFEM